MLDWFFARLISLPGIIIALCVHEYAHAYSSYMLGDTTPLRQGRLTLNPLAHIDWIGFVALLLCGFGWGKPVEINPYYYKNARRDEIIVSLAGVVSNFLVAILFAIPARYLLKQDLEEGSLLGILLSIIIYVVIINLVLMIFNLLPLPPLDGFNFLTLFFNLKKYDWWYKFFQYGNIILIIFVFSGLSSSLISPLVSGLEDLLLF